MGAPGGCNGAALRPLVTLLWAALFGRIGPPGIAARAGLLFNAS